jgi:hypothetical protein
VLTPTVPEPATLALLVHVDPADFVTDPEVLEELLRSALRNR